MLTRRRLLGCSAILSNRRLLPIATAQAPLRLAVIGTTYHYGSELQILTDRFLVGYQHDGDWHVPNVRVISMYVEKAPQTAQRGLRAQRAAVAPESEPRQAESSDLSASRAKEFGFRLCRNIPEALRAGGDQLAVAAVLACVEGDYPHNRKGQILHPRYEFFQQCVEVFEVEGRAVPYFNYQ